MQVGKDHHNWKGGRAKCHGYIYILKPEHPNVKKSGYIARSKLVVEKVIGKYLPSGAVVHHVNQDRGDDSHKNLVACENEAYHKLLHQRQIAYEACGNANWLKCSFCKKHDDPQHLYLHKTKNSGIHRECRRKYEREAYHNGKRGNKPFPQTEDLPK